MLAYYSEGRCIIQGMKKRYLVLVLIVLFGLTFWLLLRSADAPVRHDTIGQDALTPETAPAQKDDLLIVESPLPESRIASPITIKGQARGTWYFEASFPVTLTDANGLVVANGHASALRDWMTTDYVPFAATLTYTATPATTTGYLILKKDNPSGDPSKDDALSIPVTF